MTTKSPKKNSWIGELQDAAPAPAGKNVEPKAKIERAKITVQDPSVDEIRVRIRTERKPMGDIKQLALRLPIELAERLERHVAGQRHAAVLALIEFGLDETIRQNKVLEIK